MPKKKNSLVENINRRKKSGTSRPKKKSTVSKDSYQDMQKGWPESSGKPAKKSSAKKSAAKKKSARKKSS